MEGRDNTARTEAEGFVAGEDNSEETAEIVTTDIVIELL